MWSDEWNFVIHNTGHINNAGFVNDQDYDANDTRPLLAVIGDSFIEAVMVPYKETLHGRLADRAAPNARVYSFAASGAPLSQYLVWAQYAREQYRPQAMAFLIVGNDFDESLPQYVLHQIFKQFVPDENNMLTPKLLHEFHPSWRRAAIKSSALARYMFYNLNLWVTWNQLKQRTLRRNLEKNTYAGNTSASTDDQRMKDSKDAVDAFFRLLPSYSGLAPKNIAIMVDGNRHAIYENAPPETRTSYFDQMRLYTLVTARKLGYTVIDMDEAFAKDFAKNGQKFEFATDGHWNGYAHGVAADALAATPLFKNLK